VSARRLPGAADCDDVLVWAGFLKALLVAVAATLAVGCGGGPGPAAHQASPVPAHRDSPAPAHQDSPAPALSKLTGVEACLQLRGSLSRNRGVPDILTLRIIADHVNVPRMAADARNAVRDIDHIGVAPLPIALLRDDCAQAGVRLPGR
jgi:hypothetical protein